MSKKQAKVVPVEVQKAPEKAPEVEPNAVPEVQNDQLQSAVFNANAEMEEKAKNVPEQKTDGFDAYGEASIDAPNKELHPVQQEASIK